MTVRKMLAVVLVIAVAGAGFALWSGTGAKLSAWMKSATAERPGPAAKPLIYGTNLALYNGTDQVLNSIEFQRFLKSAGIPIIRMPFRSSRGTLDEIRALRAIQFIGAIPVVIVHGPGDVNAAADDHQLIQLVRDVFGASPVYVEFGNEPDLAGFNAQAYATAWNAVIPALKQIAPTYRFIGPSTSAAEPAYIAAFVKLARPLPDAISWHEYACRVSSSDDGCLGQVAQWGDHIQWVNDTVTKAIGAKLPLMITEWNLDADPDPRFNDRSFMKLWTARALQALASTMPRGLIGAMQYCAASSGNYDLIAVDRSLTPEGQAFFQALAAARSGARPSP